jgi:hypothetical protein
LALNANPEIAFSVYSPNEFSMQTKNPEDSRNEKNFAFWGARVCRYFAPGRQSCRTNFRAGGAITRRDFELVGRFGAQCSPFSGSPRPGIEYGKKRKPRQISGEDD